MIAASSSRDGLPRSPSCTPSCLVPPSAPACASRPCYTPPRLGTLPAAGVGFLARRPRQQPCSRSTRSAPCHGDRNMIAPAPHNESQRQRQNSSSRAVLHRGGGGGRTRYGVSRQSSTRQAKRPHSLTLSHLYMVSWGRRRSAERTNQAKISI